MKMVLLYETKNTDRNMEKVLARNMDADKKAGPRQTSAEV